MKIAFYILSIIVVSSCGFKEESNSEQKEIEQKNQIPTNIEEDKQAPTKQTPIKLEAIELNNLGLNLIMQDNEDSIKLGINLLNEAINIQPQYLVAYRNKVVALNKLRLTNELIETQRTLVKIEPNNPNNYVSLGMVLEINGDSLGAMSNYQSAELLYNAILDTLSPSLDPQYSVATNKAQNLKLLYKEMEANELLRDLKNKVKETYLHGLFDQYIEMKREDFINLMKGE